MTRHLLLIGAQRCGTTYLASLLDSHPDITMARPAWPEPKVFCSPDALERGLGAYRETYFGHAAGQEILAEKSTSYLESAAAAHRARAVLGAAEVVVVLRDPVARAVSNWRLSKAYGLEDRTLETALSQNLDGPRRWDRARTSVSPYAYLERGRYVDYLDPWRTAFPGAVRVAFLEEIRSRACAMAELYTSLGVDDHHRSPQQDAAVNRSDGRAPDLPPTLARRLREAFHDSDRRLADLLERELPWPSA